VITNVEIALAGSAVGIFIPRTAWITKEMHVRMERNASSCIADGWKMLGCVHEVGRMRRGSGEDVGEVHQHGMGVLGMDLDTCEERSHVVCRHHRNRPLLCSQHQHRGTQTKQRAKTSHLRPVHDLERRDGHNPVWNAGLSPLLMRWRRRQEWRRAIQLSLQRC